MRNKYTQYTDYAEYARVKVILDFCKETLGTQNLFNEGKRNIGYLPCLQMQ